ncbi:MULTISPECIES: uracil-xanthine permease family protein [Azospira]|uniref:Uracil-xanthine permease n=1 Tax=Azospira oryzae (strain ATCC BAA-33 / DSM 13638 / PS) TaxID=640081 RepID=G8QL36_AZOOP|nr:MULTISPECIES: uracil-xanthine permease family protein [Azospira]AEV26693.1 uracil-xanthine permease [Azospira oryzae PS]MDK9692227.1 uracil-xanthine permease family protein [Azospira sp.]
MTQKPDPTWRTALSGAQILFVAFGATVLVPLLTGLNPSLALLGAGVGTLIFQICTKRQVPIYLGSSFAFIAPVIYSVQTWGMPATLGALASASFFYYVAAALVKWRGVGLIHRLLPPVVIGPVVMVIGLGLAQVAVNMATGKAGEQQVVPYDTALAVAAIALVATMLTAIRARGLLKLVPILVGVAVGYVAAFFFGIVDFTKVHEAAWLAVPQFGSPEFNLAAILFMIPVAIAPIVEHVGGILAVGSVVGKDYTQSPGLHRTLLGDGLAVNVVGLFGGPPVTTYGEVTGAVMLTRNYNPVIMTWAAGFAILMAFVGKFGALLQTIPMPVMGGIMVLLFGSIAGIGLKTLMDARTDLMNPRNLCIVSVTLVTGIGGLSVTIGSFSLQGISLCGVLAVLLNLILPQAPEGTDPAI